MLKLVLDTNIIISGLLWKGNEFILLQKIEKNEAKLFINKEILEEIYKVLNYPRIRKYITKAGLELEGLFEKVNSLSHRVFGPKLNINVCRDPKDNMFIECAIHAKADYIVSGDIHLLKLNKYKNIPIVRTSDILKIIK